LAYLVLTSSTASFRIPGFRLTVRIASTSLVNQPAVAAILIHD
jgi:hypothetical protein